MNRIVKDALTLTLITLIAGVALGAVHEITAEPIARAQEQATQEAYRTVFMSASAFEEVEGFDSEAATKFVQDAGYTDDEIDMALVATDGAGTELGYVITVTSHAGYGGDITFSMGVTMDGVMNGYSITSISETAGLGMKANSDSEDSDKDFADQFKNLPVAELVVTKTGSTSDSEIDAISGATITSRAMTAGVNAGFVYYESLIGGAE